MIGRAVAPVAVIALMLSLAACGEKPQTLDASAKKVDAQPWSLSDAANPAFKAPGWKAGDKTSWEQGLKARAQNTQNEYSKTVSPK